MIPAPFSTSFHTTLGAVRPLLLRKAIRSASGAALALLAALAVLHLTESQAAIQTYQPRSDWPVVRSRCKLDTTVHTVTLASEKTYWHWAFLPREILVFRPQKALPKKSGKSC